ncbi:MAG: hypothetical protein FWH19_05945, partial [Treponema sp.]|nr:hypothetical protein [Treponema sp.]
MKHSTVKIIFCVFFLAGCGSFQREAPEQNHFTAALWNAHNLFDGVEAGTEYAEFRAEAGWTEEKYQARLTSLSQAILQMAQEPGSRAFAPDLIALAEIENLGVLEDLSRQLSSGLRRGSRNGYHWAAFSKLPGSAIGLGFLSRFPMTEVMAHSITIEGESAPRPVLEVRIEPGAEPLAEPGAGPGAAPMVFLLCHWKSKLGGA